MKKTKHPKGIIRKEIPRKVVKKYRPKSYFDPKSFRWIRSPKSGPVKAWLEIGCKKGFFKHGVCSKGTELREKLTPKKNKRKNPLLMVLPNSASKRLRSLYERYARKYSDFSKACNQFKLQHGFYPTKFKEVNLPHMGSGRMSLVNVGKTSETLYVTPRRSQKGNLQPYIHNYKRMPNLYTDYKGKALITLPKSGKLMKGGWITA